MPREPQSDVGHPVENLCHENSVEFCEQYADHAVVMGWLFFALPGMPYSRFVSHSVVRRPDGMLMDVTPRAALRAAEPYPFLPSGLSLEEYADLARDLYLASAIGTLDWWHAT